MTAKAIHQAARRLVVAIVAVSTGVVGFGQSLSSFNSSSSRITSPTVVLTYLTHNGELALLVLWRGSPAWFQRLGGGGSGGGGTGSRNREWLSFGGLTFTIDFDYSAGTATLLGRQIVLKDTNIVLVDEVDSSSGAKIVRIERVDPTLPTSGDPAFSVLRRQPELLEYLQCDLAVPDPAMQAMTAFVCRQIRGQ